MSNTYKSVNDIHDHLPEVVDKLTIGNTSDTVILPLTELKNTTTLAANGVYGSRDVTLTSPANFAVGQCLRIIDPVIDRYYYGRITGLSGSVATLNTPLDATYTAGSQIITANGNMAVDGSVTPVIFKLRHGAPSIGKTIIITRLMIGCVTDSKVDLNKFANIDVLLNGLVFRILNGHTKNLLTLNANIDLATIAYDFTVHSATNPQQGIDGFVCRFTLTKLGTTLRIEPTGNFEVIVQDDLTDIDRYSVYAEGYEVD